MYIKAYAKINLYLDVIGKRDDGYHQMRMVILPLELHDSIQVEVLPYFADSYITCDHVDLQQTKYNLINLTINKLRELYKFKQNFNISIHKEIPIQAGLGGGSSNGAVMLNTLNKLLKLNIDDVKMNEIATSLGADVPFCLKNRPSIVEGIGEKLTEIPVKYQYFVIIIKPKQGLSTKRVFEKADTIDLDHGNIDNVVEALKNGDDDLLASSMFNSLEKASLLMLPEIQDVKDMLKKDGFKIVLMSGSGSSVYALTRDHHFAKQMYKKYDKEGFECYLTKTLK